MSDRMTLGPYLLERAAGRLSREGVAVAIQPKAFDLLWFLAARNGEVASHAEILSALWPGTAVSEDALHQMIRRIRRVLGDEPPFITSVPRRGYRCAVPPVFDGVVRHDLIGRDALIAEVTASVRRPGVTVLVGEGGAGKTSIARVVADALGAKGVALAGATDDAGVVLALAAALEVQGADLDAVAYQVGARLGAGALWVLDNVEQVQAAVSARLSSWQARWPALRVLATSRLDLEVTQARAFEVGPLEVADAAALFSRAGGLTDAAVPRLVVRLGCNPLAVELAAARARVLTPQGVLDRLDRRLDLLTGARSGLRESIALSWRLLAAPERSALVALALFDGELAFADAEAVLGDIALTTVPTLAEHRLVRAVGPGRLAVPENVRSFALEQSGEVGAAVVRHAEVVVAAVEALSAAYARHPTREGLDAVAVRVDVLLAVARRTDAIAPELAQRARFEAAWPMIERGPVDLGRSLLLAVVGASAAEGGWGASLAARAAVLLLRAATRLGGIDEIVAATAALPDARVRAHWVAVHHRGDPLAAEAAVLAAAGPPPAPEVDPDAWLERQRLRAQWLGRRRAFADVLALCAEALGWCRTPAADPHRQVFTWYAANALKALGRLDEAVARYHEGLAIAERIGADLLRQEYRLNCANAYCLLGRFAESEAVYREVLAAARACGARSGELLALNNWAATLAIQGRFAEAADRCREVIGVATEDPARRDARGELWGIYNLGSVLNLAGDAIAAAVALRSAVALADALSDVRYQHLCRIDLAIACARTGRADEAEALAASLPAPVEATDRGLRAILAACVARAGGDRPAATAALARARVDATRQDAVSIWLHVLEPGFSDG
jgi:DNA-binding winged helix-turn-helix (wHTH) protein/tetratricopeptide (TPR) repeat protein